jgi:hypothetical protein
MSLERRLSALEAALSATGNDGSAERAQQSIRALIANPELCEAATELFGELQRLDAVGEAIDVDAAGRLIVQRTGAVVMPSVTLAHLKFLEGDYGA